MMVLLFLFKKMDYYQLVRLYSSYHNLSDDISSEEYLLPLIEEAFLDNSIPEDWQLCFDDKSKRYYYYNKKNDTASWENPNLDIWKEKISKKNNNLFFKI